MKLLRLAWAFLWARPLIALLNIALLALGVAGMVFVLASSQQLQARAERSLSGVDLVVGAKGSPLQLVLAGLLHLDSPSANIPAASQALLQSQPLVAGVVPLSLGDSYRGHRIVGTQPAYLDWYGARLAQGTVWSAPMQVVAGAQAARATGLALGGQFIGSHGLAGDDASHSATPLRVVGVLAPCDCVLDQLLLTDLQTVWDVHEVGHAAPPPPEATASARGGDKDHDHDHDHDHDSKPAPSQAMVAVAPEREREVSLLLVRYRSPLAAASLPRWVNSQPALQAASPALESARLMRMTGLGIDVLMAFGGVLMGVAAVSIFMAMTHAVREREADLAMMRMLGAPPSRVVWLVLLEALCLAALGLALGLVLGLALTAGLGVLLASAGWGGVTGWWFERPLWAVVAATFALALLAAALPSRQVFRTDVTLLLQAPR